MTTPAPIALITGGSRGIGRATALTLANRGWRVVVNYARNADAAAQTCADITAGGGTALALQADVADPDAAKQLVKAVNDAWGPVELLVSNAGVMHNAYARFTRPEDWRRVMATNLDGAFYIAKAALRDIMRSKRGRILFISSDAALLGDLMRSAYAASKSGLLGLARSLARELAPSGVTVNIVSPGIIETDMTADMTDTRREKQLATIPLARFGEAHEVAAVVAFLASDAAAYITGQLLCVDGGMAMKGGS